MLADDPALNTADRNTRLPRRVLGRGTKVMLILLRVYVLLAIPAVAYAFIRAL